MTSRTLRRAAPYPAWPPPPTRWGEVPRKVRPKTRWFGLHDDNLLHSHSSVSVTWDEHEKAAYKAYGACSQTSGRTGFLIGDAHKSGRQICDLCIWLGDFYFVYHLIGPNGVIYVGCSRRFRDRLLAHRRSASWWPEVDRYQCDIYLTAAAASWGEAQSIAGLRPPGNSSERKPYLGITALPHERSAPVMQIEGNPAPLLTWIPR